MIYAGFWRRFAAYMIDICPILVLCFLAFFFFFGFDQTVWAYLRSPSDPEIRKTFLLERGMIRNVAFVLWIIYGFLADASPLQGTLGKRLLGLRVVDEAGNRLSYSRALGRNTAKILSGIPLALGFMWAGWSKTKQAWHDSLAHCYVVRKPIEPIAGNP